MTTINDYVTDPNRALIDAATDPMFSQFMEPDDFELISVDRGDGTQIQVQALSRRSIRRVIEKILRQTRDVGVDIKTWICSPDEFNLCSKLKTPLGELMRDLHKFLESKWTQGGLVIVGFITITATPAVSAFFAIFSAVGFINSAFVELCNCPHFA